MAAKMAGNNFLQKVPDDSAYTLWVKSLVEITLSRTLSQCVSPFMQKFNLVTKTDRLKLLDVSAYTLHTKNFIEITVSCTISETKVFLHFVQKFKMATKNGGKTIFGKTWQMTLHTPCGPKMSLKSLYYAPFLR